VLGNKSKEGAMTDPMTHFVNDVRIGSD
jgi:hypothetical protein